MPHHPKTLTQRATSSGLYSQMASGSKTKESSNYRSILKESLNYRVGILTFFFLQGENRNSPKLQGGKNILTQKWM